MRARTTMTAVGILAVTAGGGGTVTAITHAVSTLKQAPRHVPGHTARPASPVAGTGEEAFLTAVLRDLGAPVTSANLTSLARWVQRETSWPPVAASNPLNSTLYTGGATVYNTIHLSNGHVIHVWNYPSAEAGAAMTAATIANGSYPHIVAAFLKGTGVCHAAGTAAEFGTWSGNGYTAPAGC